MTAREIDYKLQIETLDFSFSLVAEYDQDHS